MTLLDRLVSIGWFRRPRSRRIILGVLAILFGILSLFPQRYLAEIELAPPDTSTAALSAVLSQLGGNYAALLANQTPQEVDLTIARSYDVSSGVVQRLNLVNQNSSRRAKDDAILRVRKMVNIRALRGGILEVQAKNSDPVFAERLVDAYAQALQHRLTVLSRAQVEYKRQVLNNRLAEATQRLSKAEAAMSQFRSEHGLPSPEAQLGQAVATLTGLEASIQAKQAELQTALRFQTPESYTVKHIQSELSVLQQQLAAAKRQRGVNGIPTAAAMAENSVRYNDLYRDLRFAQTLYESYTRYIEGSAVEDLTASFNLQVVETSHIDPHWQFNYVPLAILILIVLTAIGAEIYLVAPPVGQRMMVRP